jgi:hypothetical protein
VAGDDRDVTIPVDKEATSRSGWKDRKPEGFSDPIDQFAKPVR